MPPPLLLLPFVLVAAFALCSPFFPFLAVFFIASFTPSSRNGSQASELAEQGMREDIYHATWLYEVPDHVPAAVSEVRWRGGEGRREEHDIKDRSRKV